ncbi:MAG: hypothetical protein ABSG37_12655 [Candidatus Limnocylindrales bacterium]|jgi:hypothetical protein
MTDTTPEGVEVPASGTIPYLARAAMQDSVLAMGRDVVRALVEMITNASDSYSRLERRGVAVDGVIEVAAERVRSGEYNRIIVRDHAEGMRRADVDGRILQAGARTSEVGDRGVQGRGAKDIAFFGKAEYESIKDGRYAHVLIDGGSRFDDLYEHPATPDEYERLGVQVSGNGTQVTLYVRRRQHSVPQHAHLARRLSQSVQLRGIMTSDARTVTLADLGRADALSEVIRYRPPSGRTMVKSVEVAIEGVPEATGSLVIYRCAEPLEDDRSMERQSGIVIEDGSGIHEATYFALEGRTGALSFSGWLSCPYIRTLQDRYDDAVVANRPTDDPNNPVPIIPRTRTGLSRDHPFTSKLAAFVEKHLRPLVDEEEAQQAQHAGQVTEDTRKRLRQVAKDLGAKMAEVMKRLEVEYKPEGGEDGPMLTPAKLRVVPPSVYLLPEAHQTFSVHAWPEAWGDDPPEPWTAAVVIADESVATLSATEVQLEPDPRETRRRRGVFQVTAGTIEDATLIEVRLGGTSEIVEVEVAAEDTTLPPTPTRLMFSQASYRARPTRPKTLVLMAPVESVAHAGTAKVRLTTTHQEISVPETVALELRDAGDGRRWYETEVAALVATATSGRVRAALGDEAAVCQVSAVEDRGHLAFEIDPQYDLPRYGSQGRADWRWPKGVRTLHIFARHPSLSPYFGDQLSNQESREARILMAEIVANELAMWTLAEADVKAAGGLSRDAQTYRSRLNEISTEYLTVAHRSLVPETAGPQS